MKKYIIVILVLLFVWSIAGIVNAEEYAPPAGLLRGKTGTFDNPNGSPSPTWPSLESHDGSNATYATASNNGQYFILAQPTQIKGYYFTASSADMQMRFYDSNWNLLSTVYATTTFPTSVTPINVNNVSIVYIKNIYPSSLSVYEFEVYDQLPTTAQPPAIPLGLTATGGDAKVDLSWTTVTGATSYNVKRSNTSGGPYTTIATSVTATTYTDTTVTNGTTYYYVVTAVNAVGESGNSNQASATPQAPALNHALLTIYLINGDLKEFDLSMNEVNDFVNWYETKSNGIGSAAYGLNKGMNNKGPFLSRKDYVIFDKIVSFEISEYQIN